ncbi:MAG TPA: ABC transporter permease [Longimicrobiales bacterium]|nr:ABC transporter permease [Longimicrobiales bacterium]
MNIGEAIRLALMQIRTQKLKSFFSVVGVIIGVMFLITVVSVVEGMNRYIEEDFANAVFGINTLTVSRTPEIDTSSDPDQWREYRRRPRLRFEDADAIRRGLRVPAIVGVTSGSGGSLVSETAVEINNVRLVAASSEIFRIRNYEVVKGRAFTAPEDRLGVPVIVLGWDAADKLFASLDPIDRIVKANGLPFRVIGVLEKQGSLFGMSLDNYAVAPARSSMSRIVNPHGIVDNILVRVDDEADMTLAAIDIEETMRVRHRLRPAMPNDFAIDTAEGSLGFWERISRILFIAFPSLVAIALVVGGIVIMNIMLVSVTERTHEIGVRKAIGARRRDIHAQVLIESATLSGMGAMIGIGIGAGLAQLVRTLSPLPTAIAPVWMISSVVLGVGVGVIAGLYPAARAARLDPVVALRAE